MLARVNFGAPHVHSSDAGLEDWRRALSTDLQVADSFPSASTMKTPSARDIVLPAVHDAANIASGKGQQQYFALNAVRLVALLIAAIAGAAALKFHGFDGSGAMILGGFVLAAIAEFSLIQFQPERAWYSGRAVAESTKTLAWRYAVKGEPFGPDLSDAAAEALMRARSGEVIRRGGDRIDVGLGDAIVTSRMRQLRMETFEVRRQAYLEYRTNDQRKWYAVNARKNETRATRMRFALLAGEVLAVVLAAVSLGRDRPADFAGIAAACVASGAAWLALKQHSSLTSAYRIAAAELALQASALAGVTEDMWPQAVADAEEAISREHTMWLASRGEEPLA